MPRTRLDILTVERGLAPSRERARALILAGHVRVNGQVVSKAGSPTAADAEIVLSSPDHPYVGRGGIKLAHALDVFGLDVRNVRALDIGASTGGFTDALLQRGAASVIALDVGHNQLDWRLRTDARVIVHEGVNARVLTADVVPYPVDVVTIDVSFISLKHILPALGPFLTPESSIVALVKPQFEAGRHEVGKGGLITDPAVHQAVVAGVIEAAAAVGLMTVAQTPSPITGATGNREFFVHLRLGPQPPAPGPGPFEFQPPAPSPEPPVNYDYPHMNTSSVTPMTRVGIIAKAHLSAAATHLVDIAQWLRERGVEAIFETDTATLMPASTTRLVADKHALATGVGMVLVLGGDGTLLGMADCIGEAGTSIPILGVNFGSLGFLTEVTLPELYPSLEAALSGQFHIEERAMLQCIGTRDGAEFASHIALNDAVITKSARSRMVDLSVWVGAEFVTRVKADGLIVGTPTGSTAYNLAAGGPIVQPSVDALLITPIAPHTLTNRPVVIPATATVRVQPTIEGRDEVYVTFDGQKAYQLRHGDEIVVRKANVSLRLIRPTSHSYFQVLRTKLKWGER